MSKEPDSNKEKGKKQKVPSPRTPPRKVKVAFAQIRQFFNYTDFPLMKKLLHQWLLAGIEDQHEWTHEETVDLIYKMEFLIDLVDALWVLHKANLNYTPEDTYFRDNKDLMVPLFSSQVEHDMLYKSYCETDFFTPELSKEETQNPFLVVHAFFKDRRPNDIYWKLHRWRDTALTNPWEYNAMNKVEMTQFYEEIDRLVEAAFIINEIQQLREEQKDE